MKGNHTTRIHLFPLGDLKFLREKLFPQGLPKKCMEISISQGSPSFPREILDLSLGKYRFRGKYCIDRPLHSISSPPLSLSLILISSHSISSPHFTSLSRAADPLPLCLFLSLYQAPRLGSARASTRRTERQGVADRLQRTMQGHAAGRLQRRAA